MAYNIPWDESAPDGSITAAADIDVIIQQLKESIRERLEDVIPDWANDGVDPKTIPLASIIGVDSYIVFNADSYASLPATWDTFNLTELSQNGSGFTLALDTIEVAEAGTYMLNGSFFCSAGPGATVLLRQTITGGGTGYANTASLQNSGINPGTIATAVPFFAVFDLNANDKISLEGMNGNTAAVGSASGINRFILRRIA